MQSVRGLKPAEFPGALYRLLEACFLGSAEDRRFYKLHHERPYGIPTWECSRVLDKEGQIVSHVCVWPFTAQLMGGGTLHAGGIRDVCTDPSFRKQGLGHVVLEDAIAFMQRSGMDVSLLYAGPVTFYGAKGYQQGIPAYQFNLVMDGAARDKIHGTGLTLEPLPRVDAAIVRQCIDIRNATGAGLSFTVTRDEDYFRRILESRVQDRGAWLVKGSGEETIGYLIAGTRMTGDRVHLVIEEARVIHEDPVKAFKAILPRMLRDTWASTATVYLSPRHAITRAAIDLGASNLTNNLSGIMLKIINVRGFVEKLVEAANAKCESNDVSTTIEPTEPVLVTLVEDAAQGSPSHRFSLAITGSGELQACHEPRDHFTNTFTLTHEMLVTLLFSPLLSLEEAIEDELVHATGTTSKVIGRLLGGWSWDKEHVDYF